MAEERKEARRKAVRESWQDYDGPQINPDWWSRLMALGAMLLAGAALVNTMDGMPNFLSKGADVANSAAEQADAGVGAMKNGLVDAADAATEAGAHLVGKPVTDGSETDGSGTDPQIATDHVQPPPSATTPRSDSVATDAVAAEATTADDTSADPAEEGVDYIDDLFPEETSRDASPMEVASDATSDKSAQEPAEDPTDTDSSVVAQDDGLLELDVLDKNPRLQIVHTALRPSVDQATAAVTIKNTGSGSALITDAIFMPTKVVELPLEVATGKVGRTDSTKLVVAFTSDDNLAKQPGRHADYGRRLQIPYTIEAGETVQVHVAIENDEYRGYGFDGDLRLVFNGSEKLEVSGVTIAFVK